MIKIKFWKTVLMLVVLLSSNAILAQVSINGGGGDVVGDQGSIAYSIGQLFYSEHEQLQEGVQQPYAIEDVSSLEEAEKLISLGLFPNPTKDEVTIELLNPIEGDESIGYRLMDLNGQIKRNGRLTQERTMLSISHLPSAVYLLHVYTQDGSRTQTFKIIKN